MKKKYAGMDEEDIKEQMEFMGMKEMQMTQAKKKGKQEQKAYYQEEESKQGNAQDQYNKAEKRAKDYAEQFKKSKKKKKTPDQVDMLNRLTGCPIDEKDQLLAAVPMVAPYSMMTSHKYKFKLQPGTLKRGKAKKSIRDMLTALSKTVTEGEALLLRSMQDQEMMDPIPQSVKVIAPGMQKVQRDNKKQKKQKHKG